MIKLLIPVLKQFFTVALEAQRQQLRALKAIFRQGFHLNYIIFERQKEKLSHEYPEFLRRGERQA